MLHDMRNALSPAVPVRWMKSENWAPDEISARGRLGPSLRGSHVLLIGAGSVGSVIAELLVRGGVRRLSVMDDERVAAGNLVRHTLGLEEVGLEKATALSARLNRLGPHVHVDAIVSPFPGTTTLGHSLVAAAEVILDCTGSDAVLERLEAFDWKRSRVFCSVSLGLHARRLFVMLSRGEAFSREAMVRQLQPWLAREREALRDIELPRDGLGCWHPLHPARVDDVWRMAAAAVGEVEKYVEGDNCETTFVVHEAGLDGTQRIQP